MFYSKENALLYYVLKFMYFSFHDVPYPRMRRNTYTDISF